MRRALRAVSSLTRCNKPPVKGGSGGVIAADAQASAAMDKIMGRWDNIDNRVATAVGRKRGKVVPKVRVPRRWKPGQTLTEWWCADGGASREADERSSEVRGGDPMGGGERGPGHRERPYLVQLHQRSAA